MPPRPEVTHRSGLSRRHALLGLASVLAAPNRGNTAPLDSLQAQPELTGDLVNKLEGSLRQTVVELRDVSDDPIVNTVLDRLTLKVGRRVVSLSPNAWASGSGQAPQVQVDLEFVYDLMQEADFVALLWCSTPATESTMHRVMETFGAELARAYRAGQPPPKPVFDIERAGFPPLDTKLLALLSQVIQNNALAWIVLHEVGHHILGHTTRAPTSMAESRAHELAADAYALQSLLRIGYSPEPLRRLLSLRAARTQLVRMAGYADDPNPDHPPWDRRSQQIDALSQGHVIPSFPIQAIEFCSESNDGAISSPLITYDTDPTVTRSLAAIGDAGGSLAIYERNGTTLTVYARSAAYRQEIVVEQTDQFVVQLSIRTIASGVDTSIRATAVNLNFATRQRVIPDTPNLVDLMGLSSGTLRALNLRLLGSEKAQRVNKVQADTVQRLLGYFLDYCRGKTDMGEYLRRSAEESSRNAADLRRAIGERDYPAYHKAVDQLVRDNIMTEGILARLDRLRVQHNAN